MNMSIQNNMLAMNAERFVGIIECIIFNGILGWKAVVILFSIAKINARR